ncbi:MAG: aspartyl/glutamyl-tRNA amidotransferase subunit C [Lachnospiraceae bacterium]|nr:aspartyl/glutamyl-tRNA amidotransferase subunit C [Lachnospiraceae bacterium]
MREEIIETARLAQLDFTEDELTQAEVQLGRMLAYVNRLSKLPAGESEDAPAHVNVFREDVVRDEGLATEIIAGAPEARENQFVVPKTFANE